MTGLFVATAAISLIACGSDTTEKDSGSDSAPTKKAEQNKEDNEGSEKEEAAATKAPTKEEANALAAANAAIIYELVESTDGNYYIATGLTEGYEGTTISILAEYEGLPVKEIKSSAFSGNKQITEIIIPESITKIGNYAFDRCSGVTSVKYFAINCKDLRDNSYAFRSIGNSEKGFTVTIGNKVEHIPAYLFASGSQNCNLTNVIFEETSSCKTLGEYCFDKAVLLQSIVFPDSVTEYGKGMFRFCTGIESVTLSAGATATSEDMFMGCTALTSIALPEGYTTLASDTFGGCSSLTSITLPDSLTTIGDNSISRCTSLTELTIPVNVETMEFYCFYNCSSLTTVYFNARNCADLEQDAYIFEDAGANTSGLTFVVGKTVERVPGYLFTPNYNGANLTDVVFEEGSVCTTIGKAAFASCLTLLRVELPDSLTTIENLAFCQSKNIISITIPASVTYIQPDAFWWITGDIIIKFEDPEGWWFASREESTSGNNLTADEMNDTENIRQLLTITYSDDYWHKN